MARRTSSLTNFTPQERPSTTIPSLQASSPSAWIFLVSTAKHPASKTADRSLETSRRGPRPALVQPPAFAASPRTRPPLHEGLPPSQPLWTGRCRPNVRERRMLRPCETRFPPASFYRASVPLDLKREQFELTRREAESMRIADRARIIDKNNHGVLAVKQRIDAFVNLGYRRAETVSRRHATPPPSRFATAQTRVTHPSLACAGTSAPARDRRTSPPLRSIRFALLRADIPRRTLCWCVRRGSFFHAPPSRRATPPGALSAQTLQEIRYQRQPSRTDSCCPPLARQADDIVGVAHRCIRRTTPAYANHPLLLLELCYRVRSR